MTSLLSNIASLHNIDEYKELMWTGSFDDYLALVKDNHSVVRSAYQRVYDMILSHGSEEYVDNKKKITAYNFFKDDQNGGVDAIFGLDISVMKLVNVLKSAAFCYGTEKRVI